MIATLFGLICCLVRTIQDLKTKVKQIEVIFHCSCSFLIHRVTQLFSLVSLRALCNLASVFVQTFIQVLKKYNLHL